MKNIFYTALVVFLFFQSCSTDFDLTSNWKDVSIVYGLLDKNSDTTFIRINKAFLDPKTSAVTLAQNPDSLFYKNLDARLEEYDANNHFVSEIQLTRADGNLEGREKNPKNVLNNANGTFALAPNYLYQTTHKINQDYSYRLVLFNGDGTKKDTAYTAIVSDFTAQVPLIAHFFPGNNFNIAWVSALNGKVYDLTGHFHYHEIRPGKADTAISIDWTLFKGIISEGTLGHENMHFDVPGINFYNFVNSQLSDNPNVSRVADSLSFTFAVAGEAYYNYSLVEEAQLGLTAGQTQPIYTNISNGVGLFSSRTFKKIQPILFDQRTTDSLACGYITGHLRFKNFKGDLCH